MPCLGGEHSHGNAGLGEKGLAIRIGNARLGRMGGTNFAENACSFNGLSRRELNWFGAHLFVEGEVSICEYCLGCVLDILAEQQDEITPARVEFACRFCRARQGEGVRIVLGPPDAAICDRCAREFERECKEPRNPWSVVRRTLTCIEHGWALMALFERHHLALTANGRSITDVGLSNDDEHSLASMIAMELTPHDRSIEERLPALVRGTRVRDASAEEISQFLAQCNENGVAIGW
jgi:hypothetical protein